MNILIVVGNSDTEDIFNYGYTSCVTVEIIHGIFLLNIYNHYSFENE